MLRRLLRKFKLIPLILSNLEQIKRCDVILSAYPTHVDLPLAYIISRIFRKPLIFDPLWSFSLMFIDEFKLLPKQSLRERIIRFFDKTIFSLPDYFLFDTVNQRDYYCKALNIPTEKTRILPIGADNSLYEYSGINKNKKTLSVIYYGLYNPMHGVEHIIECANLCRDDLNIEFIMIGKGQTYAENKKRAEDLKLTNVQFLPEVTEKNAQKYFAKGDVLLGFLNTSLSASLVVPNKVFQGFALGKVVVTAATPVMKETFLHKENIYLCKLADPHDLAIALKHLKKDPELRAKIAQNGYQKFLAEYTPDAIGIQFSKILEDIMHK